MTEQWAPALGFPGYEVSNFGRVRSLPRTGGRGRKFKGRILKQHPNRKGYMQVGLCIDGVVSNQMIHRLVLESFVGEAPTYQQCRHLDGNRANNKLTNLCWGTLQENHQDKIAHGTDTCGEKHPQAKLTRLAVLDIRANAIPGTYGKFARKYGVCRDTISVVVRGKTWSTV